MSAPPGPDLAGDVLRGVDDELDERERLLAAWARRLAGDPNGTTPADVDALRAADPGGMTPRALTSGAQVTRPVS